MRAVLASLAMTLLLLPAPPLAAAASAAATRAAAVDTQLARADRWLRAGAPESVLTTIEPLFVVAAETGDRGLELRALLYRAGALALVGELRRSEQAARRARELAVDLSSPAAGRMAQRWLGYSLLCQGRSAEAAAIYTALREEARAAGDHREEGYALLGLAYQALGRGEAATARVDYERSAGLFAAAGEQVVALDAQVGLARALGAEGRFDDMRRLNERILREAERVGQARIVGYVLNNLGSHEYQAGDPGRAVDYWQRALATKRSGADPLAMITPQVNLALARMSLGAFDEARETLQATLADCRAGGYREQEAQVLEQMATLEQSHGRREQARALWRQVMDMGPAAGLDAVEAAVDLGASLAAEGRGAEAIAVTDSLASTLPSGADSYLTAKLDLVRAQARAAAGRHLEALVPAARARARFRAGGFRTDEVAALMALATSERELARLAPGHRDSALARLREAQHLWEDVRAIPRDPQWRERRGTLGTAVHMELALLLLEASADRPADQRAREAFDALQGYKARTLLERRLGPDGDRRADGVMPETPVTLALIQRQVLRPGEVLLDYYLGERASLVFAVTDSICHAVILPPARVLRERVGLFVELVAAPPTGVGVAATRPAIEPAARRIARELLDPCAADLATARGVLIAADGLLNRLPFELLPVPGREDVRLGSACAVARIPSTAVLTQLRGARPEVTGATVSAPRGLVLLAGDGPGEATLPGAAREARQLARDYFEVRELASVGGDGDSRWLGAATGAAVLHIPAHSEAFDQRPWNSRIRVGTDRDGHPRWLASAAIAAAPLDVPLAVLSGCSSAGGQALSGEGMLGLTGAFLAAGSRAVVASLWDVDDGATALLMERFYAELAAGRTVAGALAAARRALAREPATADPSYWAGFVVVGDGELAISLRRRPPIGTVAACGAGGLAALGAGTVWFGAKRRRRGSPVIRGTRRTLS